MCLGSNTGTTYVLYRVSFVGVIVRFGSTYLWYRVSCCNSNCAPFSDTASWLCLSFRLRCAVRSPATRSTYMVRSPLTKRVSRNPPDDHTVVRPNIRRPKTVRNVLHPRKESRTTVRPVGRIPPLCHTLYKQTSSARQATTSVHQTSTPARLQASTDLHLQASLSTVVCVTRPARCHHHGSHRLRFDFAA